MKFYSSTRAVMLLALIVLIAAAWLRGAEYDEQYTLFLTAGTPRPAWPDTVFSAGMVSAAQAGHATLAGIASDLRATDVHPPLYFWAEAAWRAVFGPGLFAARLFSVLCGLASLALIGIVARQCRIGAAAAMLVTLGCHGFVYTNAIARGFAPAQMFCLAGVALLLARRPVLAGALFGAACGCNYLAVFVAAAAIAAAGAWSAVIGAAPFLALDAWFFAAQHGARPDQFPPFALWPSLARLIEYQMAAVLGGLPLYVDGAVRVVAAVIAGVIGVAVIGRIALARPLMRGSGVRPLLAAAVATPVGLLLLGAVFDNTPIELRYLSFGLPFVGLMVAWALAPCRDGRAVLLPSLICLQVAAILGLLASPRAEQPFRSAADEAARLVGDGIVLVPRGNDSVGIVGAFGIEAPPALPLLLVGPGDEIAGRVASYHRIVVALLGRDRDSTAVLPVLRAAFAGPNWRVVAIGSNVEVYERIEAGE